MLPQSKSPVVENRIAQLTELLIEWTPWDERKIVSEVKRGWP
jgi:hypothetical protein